MNYKDTLNSFEEPEHIYEPETRAEEISQDIHAALDDGSIFGELIASSVGEAISNVIDKSGLDAYISDNINNLKSSIAESITGSLSNEDFVKDFAETIAQKEVDRELQSLPGEPLEKDKELEE